MKIYKILLILFLVFNFSSLQSESNIELQNKITKNIRCLICQGQSVYDSDSEFAMSLKSVINDKIKDGFSEEQIYRLLKEKYGEWILYEPGLNKNTYILWLLPILLFLIGGVIIYRNLIIKKN